MRAKVTSPQKIIAAVALERGYDGGDFPHGLLRQQTGMGDDRSVKNAKPFVDSFIGGRVELCDLKKTTFFKLRRTLLPRSDIPATAKLIDAILTRFADYGDQNLAFPRQPKIAAILNLSTISVIRNLKVLKKEGLWGIARNWRRGNSYQPLANQNELLRPSLSATEFEAFAISITKRESQNLAKLPYAVFLTTKYWFTVRDYVVSQKPFCGLCPSTHRLNAHHRTYARHGYEHLYWSTDLIVLCNKCHMRHHDIVTTGFDTPGYFSIHNYAPEK